MQRRIIESFLLGAALLLPTTVQAQDREESFPRFEAEIDIEIQNDWNFDSDDPDNEFNNLFTTTEPGLGFYILPGLSIQSGLVIEEIDNTQPGEDRVFDQHGLFVEQLYLLYEQDAFAAFGGKFNPSFGIGWDITPGVYGTDLAEEFYEQTERIGFGGALFLGGEGIGGDGFGEHTFTAQTFFADTTILSEAFGEERAQTRLSSGGASNTEDLSSFSVTLEGGGFEGLPVDPTYYLGVTYQEGGQGDPEDLLGFAAGLSGAIEITDDLVVEPFVEYVHFDNAEAQDQDRDIFTAAVGTYYGPWNLALAYTEVWTDPGTGVVDRDVHQYQISAGYSFDFGLDVDIGYKLNDDEDVETHTVGVLFHYALGFAVP